MSDRARLLSLLFSSSICFLSLPFSLSFAANLNTNQSSLLTTKKMTPLPDAAAYNHFFSASVDISDASFNEVTGLLSVTRSVRDVDCNTRRKYLYNYSIESDSGALRMSIPPLEIPSKVLLQIPSPSGLKMALLIKEDDVIENADNSAGNTSRQVFEIWTDNGTRLERRIVLPKDMHGKVCTDTSWFGGIAWNPDENALVYVAEQSVPKTASHFADNSKENDDNDIPQVGAQYTMGLGKKEDWGEKYTSTSLLRIFCLSIKTGKVGMIENCPGSIKSSNTNGSYTFGQPIFSPCGNFCVYTAWDAGEGGNMPKRLGSIYCSQRPSRIYCSSIQNLLAHLSTTEKVIEQEIDISSFCLTPNHRLACSPRFSKSNMAFLGSKNGFDTHAGNFGLYLIDWDSSDPSHGKVTVLVNEARTAENIDNDSEFSGLGLSFPGLFCTSLPTECFTNDGAFVVLSTLWGSVGRVLKISTDDGTIFPIELNLCQDEDGDSKQFSQSLLCISKDHIYISQSTPKTPSVLGSVCLKTDKTVVLSHMSPISVTSQSSADQVVDCKFSWKLLHMKPSDGTDGVIQSILLLPDKTDDEGLPPLIVVPHGGPHSVLPTSYIPSYAFLCSQGKFAILEINYRGSTGFGQDILESLTGSIGTQDVEDCLQATKAVIDLGLVDPGRVGVCGGSHGGFLSGHLIGQYPNLFKVAAMRNPVTNIVSMPTSTDIPDWCYVEVFGNGKYDWTTFRPTKRNELLQMFDASPCAYIDNVCAPTLIALGMSDRRVPPSQGLEYFYSLRAKGVKTKLLTYDKCDHAIDLPTCEADHWINILQWFQKYL